MRIVHFCYPRTQDTVAKWPRPPARAFVSHCTCLGQRQGRRPPKRTSSPVGLVVTCRTHGQPGRTLAFCLTQGQQLWRTGTADLAQTGRSVSRRPGSDRGPADFLTNRGVLPIRIGEQMQPGKTKEARASQRFLSRPRENTAIPVLDDRGAWHYSHPHGRGGAAIGGFDEVTPGPCVGRTTDEKNSVRRALEMPSPGTPRSFAPGQSPSGISLFSLSCCTGRPVGSNARRRCSSPPESVHGRGRFGAARSGACRIRTGEHRFVGGRSACAKAPNGRHSSASTSGPFRSEVTHHARPSRAYPADRHQEHRHLAP